MCKRVLIAVVLMGMAGLLVGAVLAGTAVTAVNLGLGLGMMIGGFISGFMALSVLNDLEEFEDE